ncbi:MAG TPA: Ig-like domain-containing protein [Alphaproteobacteria bacterium]|jgi:hypothetical protein|nr:Ig-like domain-containing protein [Alphaproteobacteria bacterium]
MIKTTKIPTLLGIIILLVGTFAGVFFLNMQQVFKIGADASAAPKDVRISNITDSSATITWSTDKETTGFVTLAVNETTSKTFNHAVTLTGLKPNSAYSFKINSNGTEFDNNKVPWKFTTSSEATIKQNLTLVSGSIITPSGQPGSNALVYMTAAGKLLSTLTSDAGNFIFQVSTTSPQDLLEISAIGKPGETVSAKVLAQSANPIPPMIFGQVYDYRNLPPNGDGTAPDANLNLPADSSQTSKFQIQDSSIKPTKSVILESLTEGEIVTSDKPQFFGKGPGGETITITVESENPVTENVTIPKNGSWNWSVPQNLAAGAHKITVSWVDASGITRKLTRNFIVQASELPAFVATPSQGLATASPSSSIKPTATAIATSQPVPVTGDLTPTLLLSIMGIVVFFSSFFVWKLAEN